MKNVYITWDRPLRPVPYNFQDPWEHLHKSSSFQPCRILNKIWFLSKSMRTKVLERPWLTTGKKKKERETIITLRRKMLTIRFLKTGGVRLDYAHLIFGLSQLLSGPFSAPHCPRRYQYNKLSHWTTYSYVSNQFQPNVLKKTYICTLVKEKYR